MSWGNVRTPTPAPRTGPRRVAPVTPEHPWVAWIPWGIVGMAIVMMVFVFTRAPVQAFINPPVSTVTLTRESQFVLADELRDILAPYSGVGFFSFDVRALQADLEAHPWVSSAEVVRYWPDRLLVTLTEEQPIARWGEHQLLNQVGEVFTPTAGRGMPALPILEGPEGTQVNMMAQFQQISQMLFPYGLRLETLHLSERGSWSMRLSDGVSVMVGTEDALERIRRFVAIYDRRIKNDIAVIESVDLRYDNGVAVKAQPVEDSGLAAR